jgi:hypothetical protein
MKEDLKYDTLKKVIIGIENESIDLIDIKEKHNRDLTWTISVKVRIKKEIEDLKKYVITV